MREKNILCSFIILYFIVNLCIDANCERHAPGCFSLDLFAAKTSKQTRTPLSIFRTYFHNDKQRGPWHVRRMSISDFTILWRQRAVSRAVTYISVTLPNATEEACLSQSISCSVPADVIHWSLCVHPALSPLRSLAPPSQRVSSLCALHSHYWSQLWVTVLWVKTFNI